MWEQLAKELEADYDVEVNWEERFYLCPECGEPIYECDWEDEDFVDVYCPICRMI